MQAEVFAALERSLVDKLEGLDRLLDLAEAHRQALVNQDVDSLPGINERQTAELSALDKAQKASGRLLGRLVQASGGDPSRASLSDIIPSLPDEQQKALLALSASLQEKASALAWASEVNAGLSANALELIRVSLGAISASITDSTVPSDQPASLVLDQRA